MKVFLRGTMQTDSAGGCQLVFAPRRAGQYTGGGASDSTYPLMTSSGTTVFGTTFIQCDTGATVAAGISAFQFNSDYNTTQLNTGVSERLVCAGVRMRYAGAETAMAGIVHCIEEPNHNSLSNQLLSTYNQFESYFSMQVEKKWVTLVYTPVGPDDYVYDVDYANGYLTRRDSHYMGMLVVGAAANVTFQFEAMAVFEMVGSAIRDLVQAKSDMKAVEVASNQLTPNNQQMINATGDGTLNVLKNVLGSAKDFTETAMSIGGTIAKVASMM